MKQETEILKRIIGETYLYQKVRHIQSEECYTVFYVFVELVPGTQEGNVCALLERQDKSDPTQRAVVKVTAAELEKTYSLLTPP